MLAPSKTYYARNYAGIIGMGWLISGNEHHPVLVTSSSLLVRVMKV